MSRATFLVVLDGTPECRKALRFAALRARRTGAGLILLHVIRPVGFLQWGGVQRALDAEAEAEARAMLDAESAAAAALLGEAPTCIVRHGKPVEEIRRLIDEDRSIRSLVLAAAEGGRPGPLVEYFSGADGGRLPCLVIIVPGGIDEEALDRLT